jgi:hypothetical protein
VVARVIQYQPRQAVSSAAPDNLRELRLEHAVAWEEE